MELAYLFWHYRRHSIGDENYRDTLVAFHEALAQNAPEGFISSFSRRQNRLPWMQPTVEVYEDWYIVQDFTALGTLNENAHQSSMEPPHDSVAQMVASGSGGVYKLWFNYSEDEDVKTIVWLDKPPLVKTGDFLEIIESKARDNQGVVWRRQLNLGPAPEYVVWLPAGKPFLIEGSIQFPFNRI